MPKRVSIPGYDKPIEFPDSMSLDEINAASKKLYDAKNTSASTDPSGRTPTGEPAEGDDRNGFQRWADNLITPDPRKEEWQSPWKTGLDRAAQGVAENVLPIVAHPIDSAVGFAKQVGGAIANGGQQPWGAAAEFVRPMIEGAVADYMQNGPAKALPHILGQGAGMLATGELQGEALKAAGRRLSPILAKGNESLRQGIQSMVGAGDKPVRAEVAAKAEAAGKAAKATEESNRAELSKHEDAIKEAGQANVNAHVKWLASKAEKSKANALAQKAVDEVNRAKSSEYQKSLDDAGRANLKAHIEYLQKTADTARENALDAKKVEEKNLRELNRYESELADAQRKNTAAHVQHQAETAEAENANAAARAIPDSRAGLTQHIDDLTNQADVLTERARHDALAEGNAKYSTVNEELNPIKANEKFLPDAVLTASEKIKGSNTSVPILNDMETRIEKGGTPTYEDLQGYYSELGSQIVRGNLPGDVYHAMDTLHEAVGNEMQRIADSQGMGTELKSAREHWRRMKQTFGDTSDTVSDRAAKEVKEANPAANTKQVSTYRRRLLDSFNPQISKLLDQADSVQARLDALPPDSTRPTAKTPKAPEEITVKPPKIKKAPESKPGPDYPNEKTVKPPEYSPPAAQQDMPEYPEGKEVAPPKTNPIKVPDVNTRDIREEFVRRWAHGEEKLNPFQVRSLIRGGLGPVIGAVIGEHFGGMGAAAGAIAGTALGPTMVAKLVDMAPVREWLTRPPAGELETFQSLPYADRIKITDGLKKVVSQAQKQGIKVSPALLTAIGYSAHPTPPALKGSPLDEQQ